MKITKETDMCVWQCLIDSKPAVITVDCNAYTYAGKTMPDVLIVTIQNLGTSRNGFPEESVFRTLYPLEETLKKVLDSQSDIFAGKFITGGIQYYLFYTKDSVRLQRHLTSVVKNVKKYKTGIEVRHDKTWHIYFDMLYPPRKEKQRFINTQIINHMQKQGDNGKKIRLIDHAIFLKNTEDRDTFLKSVSATVPIKDYTYFDNKNEIENPYTLELQIASALEEIEMHKTTDLLIDLTERFSAVYDGWGTTVEK